MIIMVNEEEISERKMDDKNRQNSVEHLCILCECAHADVLEM